MTFNEVCEKFKDFSEVVSKKNCSIEEFNSAVAGFSEFIFVTTDLSLDLIRNVNLISLNQLLGYLQTIDTCFFQAFIQNGKTGWFEEAGNGKFEIIYRKFEEFLTLVETRQQQLQLQEQALQAPSALAGGDREEKQPLLGQTSFFGPSKEREDSSKNNLCRKCCTML